MTNSTFSNATALDHDGGNNQEKTSVYFFLTFIVMCLFFFVSSALIEKYKPLYGHETCYTILVGVTISLLIYAIVGHDVASSFKFQSSVFFNYFLPPIIFNSGYTMRKKSFFNNLGNVSVFGLAVTLVCFIIYSAAGVALLQGKLLVTNYYAKRIGQTVEEEENPQVIDLTIMQMLLFTALLCSSDVVAAVSIVDYTKQPKLFSCIFGEGVVNDIVSIILFNTVLQLQSVTFQKYTPFVILGQFLLLGIVSLAIGVIFGFFTSFIFKYANFLRVNAITETFLLFSFSLASYFVSDSIEIIGVQMSGIISLLVCGIVQSHYTYYNLSPQGKTCSLLTCSFLGTAAEAGVYSYIGIALYSLIDTWWSFEFIAAQFAIIVFGRIIAVFMTFYAFRLCFRKSTISCRELCFITYAGMIRGAVAFALVLKIPVENTPECHGVGCLSKTNYELLVTTTLILVMTTTLVFGTFIGKVQLLLVAPSEKDQAEYESMQKSETEIMEKALAKRIAINADGEESHEEIVHPNEEKDSDSESNIQTDQQKVPFSWPTSRFVKWFGKYDEHVLKPILIRRYKKEVQLLEDEYQDLVAQQFDDEDEEILVEKVLYQAQIPVTVSDLIPGRQPRRQSSISHSRSVSRQAEVEEQIISRPSHIISRKDRYKEDDVVKHISPMQLTEEAFIPPGSTRQTQEQEPLDLTESQEDRTFFVRKLVEFEEVEMQMLQRSHAKPPTHERLVSIHDFIVKNEPKHSQSDKSVQVNLGQTVSY